MRVRRRIPGPELADRFTLAAEEAELLATLELPPHPRVRDLAEWQRIFTPLADIEELWRHEQLRADPQYLEANLDSLAALWNMTPRPHLDGRRPAELFLREILLDPPRPGELPPSPSGLVYCWHVIEVMRSASRFTHEFLAFVEAGRSPRGSRSARRRGWGSLQRARPPGRSG